MLSYVGTACNGNILCGVLFICGVKNMYPTIFSVKLFPKCHLPPIIRSPRNTPQYFVWKCVYVYTLFKLYTPPRIHLPHKVWYRFTVPHNKGANVNATHRAYKTLIENTPQDNVCQHVCVCVCICVGLCVCVCVCVCCWSMYVSCVCISS